MGDQFIKFTNKEYVASMTSENPRMLFRNLEYYRRLEAEEGDTKIGDKNEGVRENVGYSNIDEMSDPLKKMFLDLGMVIGEGTGSIEFSFQSTAHAFVFCVAFGEVEELAKVFAQDGPDAYDAAMIIIDPLVLLQAIVDGTIDDQPVGVSFQLQACMVKFIDQDPFDAATHGRLEEGDIFVKSNRYASQMEYRIALRPLGDLPKTEYFFVDLQGGPYFQEIPIPGGSTRMITGL